MGKLIYDGDKTTDAKTAKVKNNFFGQSTIEQSSLGVRVCVCVHAAVSVRLPSPRAHTR